MNRRIKEALDSWDFKSLFLTVFFLSIGLVLYLYFGNIRDRFRASDEENYKGRTKGEIVDVKRTDRISQTRANGTQIFIDSYSVSYRYEVSGQIFEKVDAIPATVKNQKLLKEILDRGSDNVCSIRYDPQDPQVSLLVERE